MTHLQTVLAAAITLREHREMLQRRLRDACSYSDAYSPGLQAFWRARLAACQSEIAGLDALAEHIYRKKVRL